MALFFLLLQPKTILGEKKMWLETLPEWRCYELTQLEPTGPGAVLFLTAMMHFLPKTFEGLTEVFFFLNSERIFVLNLHRVLWSVDLFNHELIQKRLLSRFKLKDRNAVASHPLTPTALTAETCLLPLEQWMLESMAKEGPWILHNKEALTRKYSEWDVHSFSAFLGHQHRTSKLADNYYVSISQSIS